MSNLISRLTEQTQSAHPCSIQRVYKSNGSKSPRFPNEAADGPAFCNQASAVNTGFVRSFARLLGRLARHASWILIVGWESYAIPARCTRRPQVTSTLAGSLISADYAGSPRNRRKIERSQGDARFIRCSRMKLSNDEIFDFKAKLIKSSFDAAFRGIEY